MIGIINTLLRFFFSVVFLKKHFIYDLPAYTPNYLNHAWCSNQLSFLPGNLSGVFVGNNIPGTAPPNTAISENEIIYTSLTTTVIFLY